MTDELYYSRRIERVNYEGPNISKVSMLDRIYVFRAGEYFKTSNCRLPTENKSHDQPILDVRYVKHL